MFSVDYFRRIGRQSDCWGVSSFVFISCGCTKAFRVGTIRCSNSADRNSRAQRKMEQELPPPPYFTFSCHASGLRPPQASTLKNAGLAYLNLARYAPQQGGLDNDKKDVLFTPYDPLGAASLLPWKIEGVLPLLHRQRKFFNDDCLAARGEAAATEGRAYGRREYTKTRRATGEEVAGATTRESSLGPSKSVGNWRNEASVRFMQVWKEFLDHEDAVLDSQYDAVRDIYGKLADRLGAHR